MSIAAEADRARQGGNRRPRPDRHRVPELLRHGGGAAEARNAQLSLQEAQEFADITRKQEAGGEVAHSDIVKAQIHAGPARARYAGGATGARTRRASASRSSCSRISARISPWPTIWIRAAAAALPRNRDAWRAATIPDIRAAQATITQENFEHSQRARRLLAGRFPSTISTASGADQFALHNEFGQNNLGSAVVRHSSTSPCGTGARRAAR